MMQYQQQITVDLVNMVYTAVAYLALAGAAWLLLRLIQACFWLPRHMRRQNDVATMLQDKVNSYERYVMECEAKEEAETREGGSKEELEDQVKISDEKELQELEAKRKDRRECLAMLKKELKRIRDGGDPYDFSHLIDDDLKQLLDEEDQPETDEPPRTDDEQDYAESRKQSDDLLETEKDRDHEDAPAEPKKDK